MKPFWVFLALFIICIVCIFTLVNLSNANTIGVTYGIAAVETDFGLFGDYQIKDKKLDLEIDWQFQGDLEENNIGDINFALTAYKNVRLEVSRFFRGGVDFGDGRYLPDGGETRLGASFTVPVDDLDFSVKIFHSNNSPFEPIYQDENGITGTKAALEEKGISLDGFTIVDGYQLPDGSAWNAAIGTGFSKEVKGRNFDIDVLYIRQLTKFSEGDGFGDPEEKRDMIELNVSTDGSLNDKADWTFRVKADAYLNDGAAQYQTQFITGIGFEL